MYMYIYKAKPDKIKQSLQDVVNDIIQLYTSYLQVSHCSIFLGVVILLLSLVMLISLLY